MSKIIEDIAEAQNGEALENSDSAGLRESAAGTPSKRPGRRRGGIIISVVSILLVGTVAVMVMLGGMNPVSTAADLSFTTYTVGKRDIITSLSGSGAVQPANSYTVTALVSGEILNAPFEEGDIVQKDAPLYEVDSSKVANSIKQSELSLAQSQRNLDQKIKSLEDLQVKATAGGTVTELKVEVGDKVTMGQALAAIRDTGAMELTVPFLQEDADSFSAGQSAEITLDGSFEKLSGSITKISQVGEVLNGTTLVKQVTIEVKNPGGLSENHYATAMVGGAACSAGGQFKNNEEALVTALTSGEVADIKINEGDSVTKGEIIISLTSESLQNDVANSRSSLESSDISLQGQYDQLDAYNIKSPISGTIIEKHYKAGDNMESGKALCTIFDLSYLTVTLNVDELDIADVKVGQSVTITSEALGDRPLEGVVTKVNINGTTSGGVTSYPVTIRIDETGELLPGMNVQAKIITSSNKDVLAIPSGAVSRGNRVLVKTDDAGEAPQMSGVPEGFKYVAVTTGVSDSDFIEITSGLSEGDIIAWYDTEIPVNTMPDRGMFVVEGEFGNAAPIGPAGGSQPVRRYGND